MFKLKGLYLIICLFVLYFGYTKASNVVDFNNFVNDINTVKKSEKKVSIFKIMSDLNIIKNNECYVNNYDNYLDVSPVCFLEENIDDISISIDESVPFLLDGLKGFGSYYNLDNNFTYKYTNPYFSYGVLDEYKEYKGSFYEKIVIIYLESKGLKIRINKSIVSKMMFDKYSFYVVPTELANRSACSLANYRAAAHHLEGLVLNVGQELNLNALISYDSNSCRGTTAKKYLFYAGACGSSTQLFRLSLLMPYLDVVERYPHSKRWAYYYGNKISGDDAAMYETSKNFIVKNNFDKPIYFKIYEQGTKSFLVGIVGEKISDYVEINKSNIGLSASVLKNIYDANAEIKDIFQFSSSYLSYHYGRS